MTRLRRGWGSSTDGRKFELVGKNGFVDGCVLLYNCVLLLHCERFAVACARFGSLANFWEEVKFALKCFGSSSLFALKVVIRILSDLSNNAHRERIFEFGKF